MHLARVIGDVVSSVKDANLTGQKLLIVQPIAADGSAAGRTEGFVFVCFIPAKIAGRSPGGDELMDSH